MGVNLNFYTFYGVRTEYLDNFSEAYNDVYIANGYKDPVGLDIVTDGMSGEFMVFGIKLWDSGDARYGYAGGESFASFDPNNLADQRNEYIARFKEVFPDFAHIVDEKWLIHSFAYYH